MIIESEEAIRIDNLKYLYITILKNNFKIIKVSTRKTREWYIFSSKFPNISDIGINTVAHTLRPSFTS